MKDVVNSRLAIAGIVALSTLAVSLATAVLLRTGNYATCMVILSVIGLVVTHAAFKQLEVDLVMILALALPGIFARPVSMWLFMVPGVLTGALLSFVILDQLTRRKEFNGQQQGGYSPPAARSPKPTP